VERAAATRGEPPAVTVSLPLVDAGIVARLRAAGCVFAEDEARLLAEAPGDLGALVARRVAGEPLEALLGWAGFRGLRIVVEPGVFVPRQRTAFLVEQALAFARPGGIAVDLCCGTGAIGAALAAAVPGLEVHAADVDPAAVACARRNLPRAHQGDLFDALPSALRGRVDVLAVNAPYVPTSAIATMPPEARDHEPRVALDGGPDGVDVHRRVAAEAGEWLAPGGVVLIETSEAQAPATAAALAGLHPRIARDDERDATVVIGSMIRPT
jgi:release factor glutamine methyltransferase